MIINGNIVDIKPYDTKNGKVLNIYIREEPAYSAVIHTALWREEAEEAMNNLQVGDSVTVSGYASGVEKGYITLSKFNLHKVIRVVAHEQAVIFDKLIIPGRETRL